MIKLILLFNIVLIYCFNISSIFKEYHCIKLNKTNINDLLNKYNNSYLTINICKHKYKNNLTCLNHKLEYI
jgi:hypothetical protein